MRYSIAFALILGISAQTNAQKILVDENYSDLTAGYALPEWTTGVKAQSTDFHSPPMGAKVYTNIPTAWRNFPSTTGKVAFEIWMRPKPGSDTNNGLHIGGSANEYQPFHKNDQDKWWYNEAGANVFIADYDGNWHHFRVVYETSANKYDLHMDGSLVKAGIQSPVDFSAGISKVGLNSGRWRRSNDTTSYFDDLKVISLSVQENAEAEAEHKSVLVKTNDYPEHLFFKPALVSASKWRSVYEDYRKNYEVGLWLSPKGEKATTLCVELSAAAGSEASFITFEGGMLALIPKEAKPNPRKTKVSFHRGEQEIIGATFPFFKEMVKSLLSFFSPYNIPDMVERLFGVIGVGEYDTSFSGTLFAGSENHTPVEVKWDETRVHGDLAKPTRIEMKILLEAPLRDAQRLIEDYGISAIVAVRASISTQRVVFIVDRLGQKRTAKARNTTVRVEIAHRAISPNPCNIKERILIEVHISDICGLRNPQRASIQFTTDNELLLQRGWNQGSDRRGNIIFRTLVLHDDGQRGDRSASDGIYSCRSVRLSSMGFLPGTYRVWIIAWDTAQALKTEDPQHFAVVEIGDFFAEK